jgi:hypothetical protein
VMHYNMVFQPLGLGANKFRRQSGKLVRGGGFVNMQDEWGNVDAARRHALLEALMVCLKYIRNIIVNIYFFVWFFFFFFFFHFHLSNFKLCR